MLHFISFQKGPQERIGRVKSAHLVHCPPLNGRTRCLAVVLVRNVQLVQIHKGETCMEDAKIQYYFVRLNFLRLQVQAVRVGTVVVPKAANGHVHCHHLEIPSLVAFDESFHLISGLFSSALQLLLLLLLLLLQLLVWKGLSCSARSSVRSKRDLIMVLISCLCSCLDIRSTFRKYSAASVYVV